MDTPPVGMVGRAFRLLGSFDEHHVTLTLSELARRSNLPINTTLRIARALVAEGALERADGRFSVGLRMYELAALAPRGVSLRQAALPYLHDLHALTGYHALLSVRQDDEAVLIERVSPRGRVRGIEYHVGGRMPLAATGAGLVLLAFAPPEVQDRAIAHFNRPGAVEEIGSATDLRRFLADVRRNDSATGTRRTPHALVSAAVPIRQRPHQSVTAALSVVVPTGVLDPRQVLPALRACARGTGDSG